MHYTYLNAKNIEDPQSDLIARVHVWTLDEPDFGDMLDFALKPDHLDKTVVCILLDWEKPWNFISELRTWTDLWHDRLGKAISGLPLSE